MSQFPNYSFQQPQINPYQQNFSQPLQVQNPYMDRMVQLQQYQQGLQMQPTQMLGASQIPQPQGIIGKVVGDFSEITANDVPMNGTSAVFPKNDMSEIQIRTWGADGKIQTISYKPILEKNKAEGTNIPQMDFNSLNEDMRALREDIKGVRDMIEKSINVPTLKVTSLRGKKEVNADE